MNNETIVKQYLVTPASGKRIIAKAFLNIPRVNDALENNTIVIIAGTTNAYIAEEILCKIGQLSDFSKNRFFRGITLPPNKPNPQNSNDENPFIGDIIIKKGKWLKEKTIFDIVDNLQKGDIILKGANTINIEKKQAGIYIGHPTGGTISAALQAVIGRRVELFLPVGLEKRVPGDIYEIAQKINALNAKGPRILPVSGQLITELEAIEILTGAEVELVASGGVCGAEGSYWLAASGKKEEIEKVDKLIESTTDEENFEL